MKQATLEAINLEAMAVSADMRELHGDFKQKNVKREDADTLANISGKNLKALAIVSANLHLEDENEKRLFKKGAINGNADDAVGGAPALR